MKLKNEGIYLTQYTNYINIFKGLSNSHPPPPLKKTKKVGDFI